MSSECGDEYSHPKTTRYFGCPECGDVVEATYKIHGYSYPKKSNFTEWCCIFGHVTVKMGWK